LIAHSDWKHGEVFQGSTEDGKSITIDGDSAHTYGLCSCTSVDVVSILKKKRQNLTALRVTANAIQAETPPRVFTHIKLTYAVRGGHLSRKAVEDAVSLSKNKYCSVSKLLEKSTPIDYEIVYPDGEPEP
jgi:putative redox protein